MELGPGANGVGRAGRRRGRTRQGMKGRGAGQLVTLPIDNGVRFRPDIWQARRKTLFAPWSRRVALFALQLVLLAALLHRFASLPTPVALGAFVVAFALAILALLLTVPAFVQVWRRGDRGWGEALFAGLLALGILAWPAAYLPAYLTLPPVNDVSTDPEHPPAYVALASARAAARAHSPIRPATRKGTSGTQQKAAYPDLRPIEVARASEEAYAIARSVIRKLKWTIVAERPPGANGGVGLIEAVDRTLVLGFADDVAVRVTGDKARARIDVRSASRYGFHDLGRNAKRVRTLLSALKARIEVAPPLVAAPRKPSVKRGDKARRAATRTRRARARARSSAQRARARRARQRARRLRRYRSRPFSPFFQ